MTKTNIYTQHSEHTEWLSRLAFYNDELIIMQKRLEEISSKNTGQEIRKEIEHFQNRFIIENNNIDHTKQHIKREEKQIQESIINNPVASDHRKTEDHLIERNMINDLEMVLNDLRKEFNTFLSKHL